MPLDNTLTDITARLRQGRFPNEQAIFQGIVLRVLQELGWDVYDTTSVWPEFQTGEGRADCRKRRVHVFAANLSPPCADSRKLFLNSAAVLLLFAVPHDVAGNRFRRDAGGHRDRKHSLQLMNFRVSRVARQGKTNPNHPAEVCLC